MKKARRKRGAHADGVFNGSDFVIPALRVLLGLQPLRVNSTRSLLRSGLPAFGTTTAYPLRVQAGIQ
jgi:hypothetical protein